MNYKIQITKVEDNPNYDKEVIDFKENNRYYNGQMDKSFPSREVIKEVLSCELTEEEYIKVKAEVIKVWE